MTSMFFLLFFFHPFCSSLLAYAAFLFRFRLNVTGGVKFEFTKVVMVTNEKSTPFCLG